jgi:putative Mn2+ efflux pump MntP
MRRILSTLVTLTWALWFGGLLMLFIAVSSIFVTFPKEHHDLAGQAAAHLFRIYNAYQLVLAAVSLIGTFIWYVVGPPRVKMGLFLLFALATVVACIITMYVAPHIEMLQQKGLMQTPEFQQLHVHAMIAYVTETVVLLIAGAFLPWLRD